MLDAVAAPRGFALPRSAAMMLGFLGQLEAEARLVDAIEAVTDAGRVLTPDLGGTARNRDGTDAVIAALEQ